MPTAWQEFLGSIFFEIVIRPLIRSSVWLYFVASATPHVTTPPFLSFFFFSRLRRCKHFLLTFFTPVVRALIISWCCFIFHFSKAKMPATGLCYCYFGPFFVTPAALQKKNPPLFVTFADHHLPSSHFLLADPLPHLNKWPHYESHLTLRRHCKWIPNCNFTAKLQASRAGARALLWGRLKIFGQEIIFILRTMGVGFSANLAT